MNARLVRLIGAKRTFKLDPATTFSRYSGTTNRLVVLMQSDDAYIYGRGWPRPGLELCVHDGQAWTSNAGLERVGESTRVNVKR